MRQQFNTVVFGTNGTGKTTFMLELACTYIEANPSKNVLFILPDDAERKYDPIPEIHPLRLSEISGMYKVYADKVKGKETIYDLMYKNFVEGSRKFNGLIINDDCGVLWNRRPEDVLTFMRRRRQSNADIISNFHGLTTDMPRAFFTYLTSLVLFKTGDNHTDTRDKLPYLKQDEFEEMYFRVENEAKTNRFYREELSLRE
jgi:hypothetical protein